LRQLNLRLDTLSQGVQVQTRQSRGGLQSHSFISGSWKEILIKLANVQKRCCFSFKNYFLVSNGLDINTNDCKISPKYVGVSMYACRFLSKFALIIGSCLQNMACVCERKNIPTVMQGAKRKRSGLVTRSIPVDKVQTSEGKYSPSKVPLNSVNALPCTSTEAEDDNSHHVKRQRMGSLDKIRLEGGTSLAVPETQDKALLAVSFPFLLS
jgi:hypothetical protein